MSRYGGMVKENIIYKIWARRFKSYAAGLSALCQPTPELPTVDVAAALTAPITDLVPMQEKHAKKVTEAVRAAGPAPEIEDRSRQTSAPEETTD